MDTTKIILWLHDAVVRLGPINISSNGFTFFFCAFEFDLRVTSATTCLRSALGNLFYFLFSLRANNKNGVSLVFFSYHSSKRAWNNFISIYFIWNVKEAGIKNGINFIMSQPYCYIGISLYRSYFILFFQIITTVNVFLFALFINMYLFFYTLHTLWVK